MVEGMQLKRTSCLILTQRFYKSGYTEKDELYRKTRNTCSLFFCFNKVFSFYPFKSCAI